jgi:CRISPR-associated endoribonuclease Cas6
MAKPFTISNLTGAPAPDDLMHLHPNQTLFLRLTTLHPHMTTIGLHGVVPIWQRCGLNLHDQPLWIAHTQKERTTYDALLDNADDADELVFEFTSPTAFKQTNRGYLADPSPRYILSSLYNRWNSFTDFSLPKSLRDVIETQLKLVDADVQRRTLSFARGRKGLIPGFYGTVHITIQETSSDARRILNALADFAPFSGVGIKTTVGMGQVTRTL